MDNNSSIYRSASANIKTDSIKADSTTNTSFKTNTDIDTGANTSTKYIVRAAVVGHRLLTLMGRL